jgi:oligoribonuclease NrnB/cAMP/cGMP phosphodiesterase (DHH superfamily)
MRPLCIYHSPCADGFTAAWVVNRALKGEVDFHPGVYGEAPPNVADRDVILVDFSYKRPVLTSLLQSGDVRQANTILVLDHHKTAATDLDGLESPIFDGSRKTYDPEHWRRDWESWSNWPVRAVFDMERSGAQIAWDFFFSREPRPLLVDYVGDRDLWRFALPLSREVNAYIFAYEYKFAEWDHLDRQLRNHMDVQDVADLGGAIERKHHKDVAELVRVCQRTMIIGGYKVPVANIPYTLTSDAGHLMAKGERFAACYWDTPNGRVFSLRSTDEGLDVSLIAKGYGGGGHRNASGFQMPRGWEGDTTVSGNG